jgi:transposase
MSQRDLPPILETAEDLETRIEHEQDARLRSRLHLLLLIRSGQVKSRTQAAKHLVVHLNSVRNWLEAYRRGGLEELLRIGTTGPRPEQKTLPPSVFQRLHERVEGEGFSGYTGAQEWLLEEFGLHVPYRTVHGLIRERLGARLARARPRHKPRS